MKQKDKRQFTQRLHRNSRQPTRARVSAFLRPGREPYPKGIKAHVGTCVAKCETANSQCRGCAYILGQTTAN